MLQREEMSIPSDASAQNILVAKGNLANSYHMLGRLDDALRTRQDVYSRKLKLLGEESRSTLLALTSQRCATSLVSTLDWQMQVCTSLK